MIDNEQLLIAIQTKDYTTAKRLLINNSSLANTKIKDHLLEWNVLDLAVSSNSPLLVDLLLEAGASVNANSCHQWTAAHRAALFGHVRCMSVLIAHEANINAWTDTHESVIFLAAKHGHYNIVKMLLAKRANIDVSTQYDSSPIEEAVISGSMMTVRYLLAHCSLLGEQAQKIDRICSKSFAFTCSKIVNASLPYY